MRGYRGHHRMGEHVLTLGTLILVLSAVVPAVSAGAVGAAPRVASQASIEQSKVTLSDTSADGPSLWTSNAGGPNLGLASVLAWTGTNAAHSLNILESSDGVTYGGKVTYAEASATRPGVAAMPGSPPTVVLAWTGLDAHHSLNLLCQGAACGARIGAGSYKKLTLWSESGFGSPALSRFGNGFALAWAGTDANHSLNILPFTVSASGFQLSGKTTLRQFSSISAPSLALNPQNNQLVLSWAATSPVGQLAFATFNGASWSGAQTLSETSGVGPAGFAVGTGSMPTYWAAWTGTNAAHSVNVRFTGSLSQWPLNNKTTLSETALGSPGFGYVGNVGQMILAWAGTDAAHHLNIATLAISGIPTLDQRIDTYIAGLDLNHLIGQTLMMSVCTDSYAANSGNLNQALKQWDVGNAIVYTSCNGTGPHPPAPASNLQQLDAALQANAARAGTLLLGIDEEGGTVDRLAPYFGGTPSAQQLVASGNPQNAYNQAQTDAGRMRSVGLNLDFAPVADVYQGGGEGPSRMFGSNVGTVTTYAGAFLDGLQQHGVAGTLKHWPGIGAATGNPDYVLPTINQSQAQMWAMDFAPFANMLYQAPGMVMATTVLAPAFDGQRPADLSPTMVNGILRGQLGYHGVVITDALGAQAIIIYMQQQGYSNPVAGIAEAAVRTFLAGNDMLLCPLNQTELSAIVTAMTNAVNSGRISQAQLRTAVHRIIRLKVQLGLISLP